MAATAAETQTGLKPVERFSTSEQAASLGSGRDAVCDGKHIRLQSNIQIDAQKFPGISAKSEDIAKLEAQLTQLTGEGGRFAGLLVNFADAGKGNESASAVGMLVFMDQLVKADPNKPQDQILKDAYKAVKEAYDKLGVKGQDVFPAFAAVLIDKSGNMHSIGAKRLAVVQIRGAQTSQVYNEQSDNFDKSAGVPTVYSRKANKGDKVFICDRQDVPKVEANKARGVQDVVAEITKPLPGVETRQLTPISSSEARAPKAGSESEDRMILSRNFGGVIDGVGGQADGAKAAEAIKQAIDNMISGQPFQTYDKDGNPTTMRLSKPLDHNGLTRKVAEDDFRAALAFHLNRIVRKLGGGPDDPAACLAFGEMYQDNAGKLSLTYAIRGDTEIAVIGKDGRVRLVKNHSIRQMTEDGATHKTGIQFDSFEKYLKLRERVGETLEGGKKGQTGRLQQDPLSVGTLDLEEGDRVVYMTDGVAEDLQNFLGAVDRQGNVTQQRGKDGRMIGMDILGKISQDTTNASDLAKKIVAKLDEVRQKSQSDGTAFINPVNQGKFDKKCTVVDGYQMVVGEKVDDGETVVVMEARIEKKKTQAPSNSASAIALDSKQVVETQATVEPPKPKGKKPPEPSSPSPLPEAKRVRIPPYYIDSGSGFRRDEAVKKLRIVEDRLVSGEVKPVQVDYLAESQRLVDEAKTILKGQSEADVRRQVMDRLMNPGNYLGKLDTLYDLTGKYLNHELLILGMEVQQADVQVAEAVRKQFEADDGLMRRSMRTEVQNDARNFLQHSGALESIYDENGDIKQVFETDLRAFTFIADNLMDVTDSTLGNGPDGKPLTYRAKFAELMKTAPTDPHASKELREFRIQFYKQATEALQTQNIPAGSEPVTESQKVIAEMRRRVKLLKFELSQLPADKKEEYIKTHYHGVQGMPSVGTLKGLTETFTENSTDELFKMSLKGADLMHRRALLEKIKVEKAQSVFHIKKLYQGTEEQTRTQLEDLGSPTTKPEPTVKPPPTTSPPPTQPAPKPPGGGGPGTPDGADLGVRPPPAPAEGRPSGLDGRIPGAPTGKEGSPKTDLPPAPGSDDRTPRPTEPPPGGNGASDSELSATIGIASTDSRTQSTLRNSESLRSLDATNLAARRKGLYKLPLLGGILYSVRHPVATMWQNNIARSVFQQRDIRYVHELGKILRKDAGPGVPMDVPDKYVHMVVQKGREERAKRSWFRRKLWDVTDTIKGITGVGQPSERKLGLRWAEENRASLEMDEKNVNFQRILAEQNSLGERFATEVPGLSLDQANSTVLKYKHESRYSAKDVLGAQFETFNAGLKQIVAEYCTTQPPMSEKEFLKRVNEYFGTDFRSMLPKDKQKDFNEGEFASNILPVAQRLRDRWDSMQHPGENGRSKWDQFTFNVYFGKAEWDPTQGRVEVGLATEKLVRMLSRREAFPMAAGFAASAVNDALTYGGAFAAGWGLSGLNFVTRKLPMLAGKVAMGPLGAVVGMGAMTTLKETGFSIPLLNKINFTIAGHDYHPFVYHGRTQKEAAQVSREVASGAGPAEKGTRRAEIEATLVQWKQASELQGKLDSLMSKSVEQMTDAEAMQLLATVADLKARFRLTDLSGDKRLAYQTQNYIRYSEGNKRKEETALRGGMLNAIARLQQYKSAHPSFGGTGPLYGTGSQYGRDGGRGLVETMSGLAEAQLRSGTDVRIAQKWLQREQKLSKADAEQIIDDFYAGQKKVSMTDREQSLQAKRNVLRKLTLKRGAGVVVRTIVTAPVASLVYGTVIDMGQDALHGIQATATAIQNQGVEQWFNTTKLGQEVGDIHDEGFTQWAHEWGDVITKGQPDVHVVVSPGAHPGAPATEHLQLDVTPFQRSALLVRNQIEPPVDFNGVHHTEIDGIPVQLPGKFNIWEDGAGHRAIVNVQDVTVAHDLSGIKLEGTVDAAGTHLVGVDASGNVTHPDMLAELNAAGISIKPGPPEISAALHEVTIWEPGNTIDHTLMVDGNAVTVQAPEHTQWQQDTTHGTWDLVAIKADGSTVMQAGNPVVLIDNAHINTDGSINLGGAGVFEALKVSVDHATAHAPDTKVESTVTIPMIGEHGRWDHLSAGERYQMSFPQDSAENPFELMLHNSKENNDTVVLDYRAHTVYNPAHPDIPISVDELAKQGELTYVFRIPGHGDIAVPCNADGVADKVLRLNPHDEVHQFQTPSGETMTLGEFSRMVLNQGHLDKAVPGKDGALESEYINNFDGNPEGRLSFNLGNENGKFGEIHVGVIPNEGDHSFVSFATILGKSDASTHEVTTTVITDVPGKEIPGITTITIGADKLTDKVPEATPTFIIDQPNIDLMQMKLRGDLMPIPPGRFNVKAAKYEGAKASDTGGKQQTAASGTTASTQSTTTTAQNSTTAGQQKTPEQKAKESALMTPEQILKAVGIQLYGNEKKDAKKKAQYDEALEIAKEYEEAFRNGDDLSEYPTRLAKATTKWKFTPEKGKEKEQKNPADILTAKFVAVESRLKSNLEQRVGQLQQAEKTAEEEKQRKEAQTEEARQQAEAKKQIIQMMRDEKGDQTLNPTDKEVEEYWVKLVEKTREEERKRTQGSAVAATQVSTEGGDDSDGNDSDGDGE